VFTLGVVLLVIAGVVTADIVLESSGPMPVAVAGHELAMEDWRLFLFGMATGVLVVVAATLMAVGFGRDRRRRRDERLRRRQLAAAGVPNMPAPMPAKGPSAGPVQGPPAAPVSGSVAVPSQSAVPGQSTVPGQSAGPGRSAGPTGSAASMPVEGPGQFPGAGPAARPPAAPAAGGRASGRRASRAPEPVAPAAEQATTPKAAPGPAPAAGRTEPKGTPPAGQVTGSWQAIPAAARTDRSAPQDARTAPTASGTSTDTSKADASRSDAARSDGSPTVATSPRRLRWPGSRSSASAKPSLVDRHDGGSARPTEPINELDAAGQPAGPTKQPVAPTKEQRVYPSEHPTDRVVARVRNT